MALKSPHIRGAITNACSHSKHWVCQIRQCCSAQFVQTQFAMSRKMITLGQQAFRESEDIVGKMDNCVGMKVDEVWHLDISIFDSLYRYHKVCQAEIMSWWTAGGKSDKEFNFKNLPGIRLSILKFIEVYHFRRIYCNGLLQDTEVREQAEVAQGVQRPHRPPIFTILRHGIECQVENVNSLKWGLQQRLGNLAAFVQGCLCTGHCMNMTR